MIAIDVVPASIRAAIVCALAKNPLTQVFTYAGCRHAFARHHGAHYDREAATIAKRRTADFFAKHLHT